MDRNSVKGLQTMRPIVDYAKPEVKDRVMLIHPLALGALCDAWSFCNARQLPFVITDAYTSLKEDIAVNRAHATHRTGRSWDISTRGWSSDSIEEFKRTFYAKYRLIGAVDGNSNPIPVYFHDAGTGPHIHFQLHSRYSMPERIFA